ncbi:sodium:calcium antiporter [Candidatus Parcubacteria bacterium]|nr:MAG: sodium:calcium antiporter [Candidatus Parcubacteria bacterium]GIW68949.1 MAG: sodium:calcium antiporter [Candidatus Parcubacteria bacterium]
MLLITLAGFLCLFLVILVKGADIFVENAKKLGYAAGFTPFVVGVLIVGVGTSLPELATSLVALFSGDGGIILGNAIGSNITNILLIVGVLGAFSHTLRIGDETIRHELIIFAVATTHFIAIANDGEIDQLEGWLLFGTYLAYLGYQLFEDNGKEKDEGQEEAQQRVEAVNTAPSIAVAGLLTVLGLAAVVIGAKGLVTVVQYLALLIGISTTVVSLTIVALGTSLPELAVSLQAFWKGDTDVAVGNIFGSNAFNILFAVGVPAIIKPFAVAPELISFSLMVLAGASFILFVSGLARMVNRWEGIMFLLFYVFFVMKLFFATP